MIPISQNGINSFQTHMWGDTNLKCLLNYLPFKYYVIKEVGGVRKWQFLMIYSTVLSKDVKTQISKPAETTWHHDIINNLCTPPESFSFNLVSLRHPVAWSNVQGPCSVKNLMAFSLLNLLPNLISNFNHYMDRACTLGCRITVESK